MLKFDEKGLIPVIVQDAADGTVLMLGYASKESLRLTLEKGEMVFWSRSRQELWHKGATSGNVLRVKSIAKDCDSDALLVRAEPAGPTCHTGERSCFFTGFSQKDLM
jgi:phosphoribosyl-AMP cyclohydrolase